MCLSTVWHLVFHYFVCCEGTINVTFTLKTLLERVYVQLLSYEDVSVCTTLTLSPRLRTNVLLKTRSHTRAHVFSYEDVSIPLFVIWDSCLYHIFSQYFYWRERLYTTFDIQGSVLNILCWPTCLHASFSSKSSVYAYVLSYENALLWLERTDYDTFQCKRHVSPYEAMRTRIRVRLRVRLCLRLRARVIEQSLVGNN